MNTRKFALLPLLILILPLILAACGGAPSPEDTEDALEAILHEGDPSDWNDMACSDAQVSDEQAEAANTAADAVNATVSCEEDGENLQCDIEVAGQNVTFDIDIQDDELCSTPQLSFE